MADFKVQNLRVASIGFPVIRLRKINDQNVAALASSMKRIGLQQPIIVYHATRGAMGFELVAGKHRLLAAKKLKWKTIPGRVLPHDQVRQATLIEIDENLCRAELTPAERVAHLAERKRLYEEDHPETKHGKASKSKGAKFAPLFKDKAFHKDTADKIGRSARAVQLDAERGAKIAPKVLQRIQGTALDKGVHLDTLKNLSTKEQHKYVDDMFRKPKEPRLKPTVRLITCPRCKNCPDCHGTRKIEVEID
jgi:ParB-like chromosome segregation protein Spo0J